MTRLGAIAEVQVRSYGPIMTVWKDEQTWLDARESVLREIRMWEESPWVRTQGRTYSGTEKDTYVAKLKDRLARIEASGEHPWRERLPA